MFTQYSVYQLLPWIRTDKISFSLLSENPAAIHLLQQNPDKIDWQWLGVWKSWSNSFIRTKY